MPEFVFTEESTGRELSFFGDNPPDQSTVEGAFKNYDALKVASTGPKGSEERRRALAQEVAAQQEASTEDLTSQRGRLSSAGQSAMRGGGVAGTGRAQGGVQGRWGAGQQARCALPAPRHGWLAAQVRTTNWRQCCHEPALPSRTHRRLLVRGQAANPGTQGGAIAGGGRREALRHCTWQTAVKEQDVCRLAATSYPAAGQR